MFSVGLRISSTVGERSLFLFRVFFGSVSGFRLLFEEEFEESVERVVACAVLNSLSVAIRVGRCLSLAICSALSYYGGCVLRLLLLFSRQRATFLLDIQDHHQVL